MAPTDNTDELRGAVGRLTGSEGDRGPHSELYRIVVTSVDDQLCSLPVGVTYHRKVPAKANLNEIADSWRIPRDELPQLLATGTHAQLVAYLEQFTAEQLLPLYIRRKRGIA